jgi:hypothetical protein
MQNRNRNQTLALSEQTSHDTFVRGLQAGYHIGFRLCLITLFGAVTSCLIWIRIDEFLAVIVAVATLIWFVIKKGEVFKDGYNR